MNTSVAAPARIRKKPNALEEGNKQLRQIGETIAKHSKKMPPSDSSEMTRVKALFRRARPLQGEDLRFGRH
jgi:hypothetical protein